MSADRHDQEFHLTRAGWQPGTEYFYGSTSRRVRRPVGTLLTLVKQTYQSCGASPSEISWTEKWRAPGANAEIRKLIRRISRENSLWGTPRIQSELRLLWFNVTEKTIAKYRIKHTKPPSQTWKTFLTNHADQIAAVYFFHDPDDQFPRFILLHRPSPRSQEARSFQCDRASDSQMDHSADHRSISRSHLAAIPAQGSRFYLWRRISKSSEGDAD